MHAGNDDEDEDADGEHQRHGHEALLCVEAAVLGCGGWGESGVVMCGLLSEGRDVTLVLLQEWAGSYSRGISWRSYICFGGAHLDERRRECSREVSAVDDDDACAA